MKTSTSIYLSLVLSVSLVSSVEAAKENFDRSKPHARATNGLDNDCNDKKAKPLTKRPQGAAGQQPTCNPNQASIKGGGHVTVLKARLRDDSQTNGGSPSSSRATDHNSSRSNKTSSSRATDHNSSRSNKTSSSRAQNDNSSRSNKRGAMQDGEDLVLRKRPGRTKYAPPGNCPSATKGKKSQAKANCPAKKQ
jgi:hypothetical protein